MGEKNVYTGGAGEAKAKANEIRIGIIQRKENRKISNLDDLASKLREFKLQAQAGFLKSQPQIKVSIVD